MRLTGNASSPETSKAIPLTRKAIHDLALSCRDFATELARLDPRRVQLAQCYKFNQWLTSIRRYDRLGPELRDMRRARPVARWQVLTLCLVACLILYLAMAGRLERMVTVLLLNSMVLLFIAVLMTPERVYGTTVEEIEGKVLRVVLILEDLVARGEAGFTEAAHFRVKEILEEARVELRQQLDLAHRP
jgi:hypothetical protein